MREWETRMILARLEADARIDQRIADHVRAGELAERTGKKRPVSSWINATVIAAWRARQGPQKGSGSAPTR